MDLEELEKNIEVLKAENEQLKETIKEFKTEYNQFKTNTTQVINGGIVGTQSHDYDVNKEVKEILKLK